MRGSWSAVADRTHLPKGYFVQPTLFADVDNSMDIAQQEVFGPVLAVIPHDGDEHAIAIANDSQYGLSGGVFSASHDRAMAFARRVRTGSISVNGGMWYARRLALRRLQEQRHRPAERTRGVRAVPRDQGRRLRRVGPRRNHDLSTTH